MADSTLYAVCRPPVSAEQKLQPLCCYLLPAGGAAQGPPLQLPRRTEARCPPAATQHHRRANGHQGNHRATVQLDGFWIMCADYYPCLSDQSCVIHTCIQEQTNGLFIYLSTPVLSSTPALILMHFPQLHYSLFSFLCPVATSHHHSAISLTFPSMCQMWLFFLLGITKSNSQHLFFLVLIWLLVKVLLKVSDDLEELLLFFDVI